MLKSKKEEWCVSVWNLILMNILFELLWLMLIQNKISLKNYIKIWLNFFFLDCLKTDCFSTKYNGVIACILVKDKTICKNFWNAENQFNLIYNVFRWFWNYFHSKK